MRESFVRVTTALGFLSIVFANNAHAQEGHFGLPINLKTACSDLKTEDGIMTCQIAFEEAGNKILHAQKKILMEPHIEKYGTAANPLSFVVTTPIAMATQLTTHMNISCANMAHKKQYKANSESLVDGSSHTLYRIAERATQCAERIQSAANIAKVPVASAYEIRQMAINASAVRAVTNRIAFGY